MKHKSNLEYYLMLKKRSPLQQLMLGATLCLPVTNKQTSKIWLSGYNTRWGCPSCILKVVSMIIIICDVTQCNLIDTYECFAPCTFRGHVIQQLMGRKGPFHCGMSQDSDQRIFRSTCPSYQNEATLIPADATFLFQHYHSPSNLSVLFFWSHKSIGVSQFVTTHLVSYHLWSHNFQWVCVCRDVTSSKLQSVITHLMSYNP